MATNEASRSLDTTSASAAQAHLQGLALVLVRVVWLATFAAVVLIFAASVPAYVAYLHAIRPTGVDIDAGQLNPAGLRSLQALGLSLGAYTTWVVGVKVVFVCVWLAVGALIFWRRSDEPVALFASFTLLTFGVSFSSWTQTSLPAWSGLLDWVYVLGGFNIGVFLYIFPDGRFVPRWTRWPLLISNLFYIAYSNLLAAQIAASPRLAVLDTLYFLGGLLVVIAVQVYRYRRVSTPLQRQQTKWIVFGFTTAMAGFILVIAVSSVFPGMYAPGTALYLGLGTLLHVSMLLIPLSISLAILRSHLWDIDIIINRTLVYALLTACIVGMYVFVVAYLGALFRTDSNLLISLVAAGLVAVAFQPLREALQRAVNRLIFGLRDEPYTVLARLSQRLQATVEPAAVLSTIVETVREALKLSYTAIETHAGAPILVAEAGVAPANGEVRLPLTHQDAPVGTLVIAPRGRDAALTPADLRLLHTLAEQIAVAVHAVQLTTDVQRMAADVQRSRERLVLAREEERRRLRRDLHDGLGPTLAALALNASNLGDLIRSDPDAAESLANALQSDIRATVADIRRLVYELRPPTLDELGLLSAIRERAEQLNTAPHSDARGRLLVTVDAPPRLPSLPAAVEVAAYRIVQEALTNVARHARARACTIRVAVADGLQIDIADDGIGLPPEHPIGVGLHSMRERVDELGGAWNIETGHGRGTRIRATLPLPKE